MFEHVIYTTPLSSMLYRIAIKCPLDIVPYSQPNSSPSYPALSLEIPPVILGTGVMRPFDVHWGPGLISLRLLQALVRYYYSGKPERVTKKKQN